MRYLCVLALLMLVAGCGGNGTPEISILFIGNSYTSVNDLPGVVEKLSAAGGHPIHQESVAVNGATLESLYDQGTGAAIQRIAARHWDFVVLQEQSQRPF